MNVFPASSPLVFLGSSSRWRRALFSEHFNRASSTKSCGRDGSAAPQLPDAFFLNPDIDEKHPDVRGGEGAPAERVVQCIARAKAEALVFGGEFAEAVDRVVGERDDGVFPVLLCLDQVVRFRGEIREKPETPERARKFLVDYMNHPEEVIECVNGICVYAEPKASQAGGKGRFLTTFEISSVKFPGLDAGTIDALIAEGSCLESAGGFVVEDMGDKMVFGSNASTMEGIEGLPINAIKRFTTLLLQENGGGKITHCLFDMDGLLLNTEDKYTIAQNQICNKYGLPSWDARPVRAPRYC